MNSTMYRKLRKLIINPQLYFEDAKRKRQYPDLAQHNEKLKAAKASFKAGEVEAAAERLISIPDILPDKALFQSSMALFDKRYADAEQFALRAMQGVREGTSTFREAFYLHQEALRFQGRFESALTFLRAMPFQDASARFFRAWRLACLGAKCPEAYESVMIRFTPGDAGWLRSRNHYILLLRDLRLEQRALAEAQQLLKQVERQPLPQTKAKVPRSESQKRSWQDKAALALSQLKEDLGKHDIEFFLVSGTLLGCIREGAILGHDTDIDVGVMPDVTMKSLRNAIKHSSRFKLQEIVSENTLYVMHPNGVKIDVFRHYEESGKLYHGGIKCRWWNTPFELVSANFLDNEYLVPVDYDAYLKENYGNWKIPIYDFDTFLDTPNMTVTDRAKMSLFFMAKSIEAWRRKDKERHLKYYEVALGLIE